MAEVKRVQSETVENESAVKEKPYTLRRLDGEDLWAVLDIAGKVLPDDLAPMFADVVTSNKKPENVGSMVILRAVSSVIKNAGKARKEVYAFLRSVSGMTDKEINALGLAAVPRMLWDIYTAEKNADFFGA